MPATSAAASTAATTSPFVISRTFNAPRERVWAAFTDPEVMKQWWGPKGFTVIHSKMDLRPGGTYHYGMRTPDGSAMWGRFIYKEIVRPERIVLINSFSDEAGGVTRHPGHMDWPLEMVTTFVFEDIGGHTRLTVEWMPLKATEAEIRAFDAGRDSMQQGWTGTLDQLTKYLAKV